MFEALFLFGAAGFVVMTLLGSVHVHGHAHSGPAHGHAGPGHAGHTGHVATSADSPPSVAAHGGHTHTGFAPPAGKVSGVKAPVGKSVSVRGSGNTFGGSMRQYLLGVGSMFISPLDIFSICMGTGAAGLLLQQILRANPYLVEVAIVCGLAFDLIVTRGMIRLALRFAAEPCEGLEGMLGHPAKATTGFDGSGRGLIEIVMDGGATQVLATLDSEELKQGQRVRKGDTLLVVEVNASKSTCRVSKDLAPTEPLEGDKA